jgi:type IV secretory pathway VirB2 component (pilin)
MEKMKAVGIALIIVGLILGIEGTVTAYVGTLILGELNSELAALSVYSSAAETAGMEGTYQLFQNIFTAVAGYSLVKTAAGIACILLGYVVLKGK